MRDQPDVDPLANPDGTSPVRLLPGATPGTFRLRWRDRVVSVGRVVMPPDLALTVELVVGERVVAEQVVVPGVPFVLEADVPAGDGAVRSQVERAVRHAWQPAGSRAWSVSEVGELVWKGRLARERFVDGLAPAWQAVADSLRPTLQWNPVDGAASYRVAVAPNPWAEDADRAVVAELAWAPTADLLPGEEYGWTVQALDAEGELLAYSNAWFRAPG